MKPYAAPESIGDNNVCKLVDKDIFGIEKEE